MPGYTKLFSSIVNSTIWREPDHVRLVWITMLALADKFGVVETSIPGLADASRVTLQECEQALERLQSPDPYSRSQEHEGRRIAVTEGGFILLNYTRYRGKLKEEKIREQTRERVRKYREKKKTEGNVTVTRNADVTSCNSGNAQSESESESESKKKKNIKKKYSEAFEKFWKSYPNKASGKSSAYKAYQKSLKRASGEEIQKGLENHLVCPKWLESNGQYVPYATTWLNQGRWDAEFTTNQPRIIVEDMKYD